MMRPATPSAILFLGAFVTFLLASLSTPVIKAIPLGSYGDYTYGVWGYCQGDDCSQIQIGYSLDGLDASQTKFTLSASTRKNVSYVLIVHPVAALLNLICLIMAIGAHFHGPSNSTRYSLGMFLMSIPAFLFSLMALLVDILLFMPHIGWSGWLVLAGTIMVLLSSILACGIRRTLSSRKDQSRRIAENAEMNGENYYNRQADKATLPRVSSPHSGDSISPYKEKAMGFSTFDVRPNPSSEDRVPLNPTINTSFRSNPYESDSPRYGPNGPNGPSGPSGSGGPTGPNGLNGPNGPSPIRSGPYGGPYSNSSPTMTGAMGAGAAMGAGMGAAMAYRGRGGYGPQRGGYPPRGRGGPYGPNSPGGYGPGPGPGMRGPPPPGWSNRGRGGRMPLGGPGGPGGPGGRIPSPTSYDDSRIISAYYDDQPPGRPSEPFGAPRSGSPSPVDMAALAMRQPGESSRSPIEGGNPTSQPMTGQAYIPPRSQWSQKPSSPTFGGRQNRQLSPIQGSPPLDSSAKVSASLDGYLEDVDPRFAPNPQQQHVEGIGIATSHPNEPQSAVELPTHYPPLIIPSRMSQTPPPSIGHSSSAIDLRTLPMTFRDDRLRPPFGDYQASLDSLPLVEGQRSPGALSEASHYTSISQRGVNPAWQTRRHGPKQSKEDVLFDNNPDFQLPAGRGPIRGRGRSRGSISGGMGPGRAGSLPGNLGAAGPSYGDNGGGAYPMMSGNSNSGRYPIP